MNAMPSRSSASTTRSRSGRSPRSILQSLCEIETLLQVAHDLFFGRVGVLRADARDHSFDDLLEQPAAAEQFLFGRHLPGGLDLISSKQIDQFLGGLHSTSFLPFSL